MVLFGFVVIMAKDSKPATVILMWALSCQGRGGNEYSEEYHKEMRTFFTIRSLY